MRSVIVLILISLFTFPAFGKKKGSPAMAAAAPGDRTCAASKCHASNELNSGNAEIFIEGLPKFYRRMRSTRSVSASSRRKPRPGDFKPLWRMKMGML